MGIKIELNSQLFGEPLDPSDYVYEYEGSIWSEDPESVDDCDPDYINIGSFRAYYADIMRASIQGESAPDVFDAHSQQMLEYYEALFDIPDSEFRSEVDALCGWPMSGPNLFVIDRVEILPQYRGQGLGLQAISILIARLGAGAGTTAIIPFPLQFEYRRNDEATPWDADMALDRFSQDRDEATAKLSRYYERVGFTPVAETRVMVSSNDSPIPDFE